MQYLSLYPKSQSPYGAKWFATFSGNGERTHHNTTSRNPLTGLSGLQLRLEGPVSDTRVLASQSPYGAKWFATKKTRLTLVLDGLASQSPYGAKWFATTPAH